jgi:phosphohistidine phosphatase
MHLLLIRHAIAAPLGEPAKRDEDRPLTELGKRRFKVVAQALPDLAPSPEAILTSPLLRARQTAEIVAKAWGGPEPVEEPALVDGDWEALCSALDRVGNGDSRDGDAGLCPVEPNRGKAWKPSQGFHISVALIGHEPWLSRVTARLLDGSSASAFDFRKGGVALIEVERPRAGQGKLLWFIPPRVFRKL